jgi:hypothetical protein
MTGIIQKIAPAAALLMVLGSGAARASYVKADIPFPFVVRGETLPAGKYVLERDDNQPSVLLIRGRDGARANVVVMADPVGQRDPAGEQPVLRFTRHGSQYWLADVWDSRDDGWQIAGATPAPARNAR